MDNIIFKRTWRDDNFYEVEVTAGNKKIICTTNFYTNDDRILDLSKGLESISINEQPDFYWENIESVNGPVNFSIKVRPKDKLGHIFIEIYMLIKDELDDGQHNCCFYVNAEIGILNTFGRNIKKLMELSGLPDDEPISLFPDQ